MHWTRYIWVDNYRKKEGRKRKQSETILERSIALVESSTEL
jgi:hypothetical protein